MKCKDCKFYDPCVEIFKLTATSVDPEYSDLDQEISEWEIEYFKTDEWIQETFTELKAESQTLGVCKSGKISYGVEYGVADSLFYQDAEDYSASHIVGPDFGCVHFERR
jgi:hypothetical protein